MVQLLSTLDSSTKRASFRQRLNFWLDLAKDDEYHLAEQIEWLKKSRQFKQVVTQGMRLVLSLRENRTDVLEQLFPRVVNLLVDRRHNLELERLRLEVEQLRNQLETSSVPKPARAASVATDDIELTVTKAPLAKGAIASNFMKSFAGLGKP